MTNYMIGQVISTIGLIISVAITQFKEVKHILLGDIAANLIVALSYVFLDGMSGAWICIVSCACAMLYVLAIIQIKASGYRLFMLLNSSLWLVYDISTAAYVNMLTHGMMLVLLVIAMLRLDHRKEKE